jgi:hypothetical protein
VSRGSGAISANADWQASPAGLPRHTPTCPSKYAAAPHDRFCNVHAVVRRWIVLLAGTASSGRSDCPAARASRASAGTRAQGVRAEIVDRAESVGVMASKVPPRFVLALASTVPTAEPDPIRSGPRPAVSCGMIGQAFGAFGVLRQATRAKTGRMARPVLTGRTWSSLRTS